jgi:hypothetical protein
MSCKVIEVPGTEQVASWTDFIVINKVRSRGSCPEEIIIKLNNSVFLKPYHIVSLACLIEEYYLFGAKISFIKNHNKLCKYLDNIRFFEYWEEGFDRNTFTKTKIDTTLCLWKINKEMISSYAKEAENYFTKNYFQNKNLEGINISLAEIFNNIYDHSYSNVDGYVLTQYYPKEDEIIISVCDFGVGIVSSVNGYLSENGEAVLSHSKALELAFKKNFSTFSFPHNKGFGLDTLSTIVKAFSGEITVLANNGILLQKKNYITTRNIDNVTFPGTCLIVILNTKNLPSLDFEQTIDEFCF